MANALVHRDYHRLGAVHVRMDDEGLTISNPGGLMDGAFTLSQAPYCSGHFPSTAITVANRHRPVCGTKRPLLFV